MKIRIHAFNNVTFHTLQWPKPKIVGKKDENGVSTPYVLSVWSYAHTQEKYAKRDFWSSHALLPLYGLNANSSKSYTSTKDA